MLSVQPIRTSPAGHTLRGSPPRPPRPGPRWDWGDWDRSPLPAPTKAHLRRGWPGLSSQTHSLIPAASEASMSPKLPGWPFRL